MGCRALHRAAQQLAQGCDWLGRAEQGATSGTPGLDQVLRQPMLGNAVDGLTIRTDGMGHGAPSAAVYLVEQGDELLRLLGGEAIVDGLALATCGDDAQVPKAGEVLGQG